MPVPSKVTEKRAPTSFAAISQCSRTQASMLARGVQVVVADVEVGLRRAGMTLVAVFGTETIVACTLEGWKCSVPLSSGVVDSRSMMRASFGMGFSARSP